MSTYEAPAITELGTVADVTRGGWFGRPGDFIFPRDEGSGGGGHGTS